MKTEATLSRSERHFLAAILVLIIFFVSFDLFNDSREGVHWPHLIVEMAVAVGAGLGILILMRDSFQKSRELLYSREVILRKEEEEKRWRAESRKYLEGLGSAIEAQLDRWSLSPSEKEIAILLLKGLSLKEIADIRKTTEKTVRAQSVSLYSKAGLSGRSELSAFFLEDLLLPSEQRADEVQRT